MKKLITKSLVCASLLGALASCSTSVSFGIYPDYHYNCYPVYDIFGYYAYDDCYWEYYNADGVKVSSELDMAAVVGDVEQIKLERMADHYSEQFGMSLNQAMKVAKNVQDFTALEDRSESDVADFAERMYGVNPSDVVSAVGQAQLGNNQALDALVNEAAQNFNISNESTRALIKELHGNALNSAGINL